MPDPTVQGTHNRGKRITPGKQLLLCGVLVGVAVGVVLLLHPEPPFGAWQVGFPAHHQLAVGFGFATLAAFASFAVSFLAARTRALRPPEDLRHINLAGSNPVWFGVAAGLGEEMLFRGALQPLLGLWWSSALFTIAHIQTARLTSGWSRKGVYLVGVFGASVALGLVFQHIGLLAAILVHATIDIAGLYTLRSAIKRLHVAASA